MIYNENLRKKKNRKTSSVRSLLLFLLVGIGAVLLFMNIKDRSIELVGGSSYLTHPVTAGGKAREWNLLLVNSTHSIPAHYHVDCVTVRGGAHVDRRIASSLQEMFDAARSVGVHPIVESGYRSYAEQETLMADKINSYRTQGFSEEDAERQAREWVAVPGTSEHQTGLAVDISYDKSVDGINSSDKAAVQKWLRENSYKYGFVLRYPAGKSKLTGIRFEPWHYRYVGKEAARELYENEICLEEYTGGI